MSDNKGYRGNSSVKGSAVPIQWTKELIQEYIKCKEDIVYFVEKYFKIVTEDGLVSIKLRDFQKEFLLSMSNNRFTIALCGRQQGKSETVRAFLVHYILFNTEKTVAVLANKESTAKELLNKIQISYQNLPFWLQVGVVEWNKSSVNLENGSRILAASTSSDSIRGYTIQAILVDEAAFVDNEEFFTSIVPTISEGKQTKLIMVSTPNGMSNRFYQTWTDSEHGKNEFNRIRATWRDVPGRDDAWKVTQLGLMGNDTNRFAQEFDAEFMGSSGTLIAGWKLKTLYSDIPLVDKLDSKQYEKPIKDHKYITICDVSRGKGLDYSAFSVIDVTQLPFKQIFTYRDNMVTPLDYAEIIYRVSKSYNNSYALIEINDIGQQVADSLFNDFDYENIIYTQSKGRAGKVADLSTTKTSDRGIRTTKTVKSVGCSILKMLIEQDKLLIPDKETIFELSTFSRKNDSYEAEPGKHDDLVIGLVLFAWLSDQQLFTDLNNISTLNVLKQKTEEDYNNEMLNFFIDSGEELEEIIQEKGNWLFPLELELVSGEYEEQINIFPNQIGNEYKYN